MPELIRHELEEYMKTFEGLSGEGRLGVERVFMCGAVAASKIIAESTDKQITLDDLYREFEEFANRWVVIDSGEEE